MPAKSIELSFPGGGLNKAMPFKQQVPYTSPSLVNVRPTDLFLGRARGGSRPGTEKAYAALLESGASVQMLSSVTYITAAGVVTTVGVAIAGGRLYYQNGSNLSVVSTSRT